MVCIFAFDSLGSLFEILLFGVDLLLEVYDVCVILLEGGGCVVGFCEGLEEGGVLGSGGLDFGVD